jgi:transposase-like protein
VPMSGDKPSARYDVISDTRRRWSAVEKAAIVAEASGDCPNISAVARRHGIKPSLLFRWKKEHDKAEVTARTPTFVPIALPAPTMTLDRDALPPTVPKQIAVSDPRIEVALANGRCVRVRTDVDTAALMRIIAALEDLE